MATQFLFGLLAAWILCGLITSFVMRRRGHDFLVWLTLGTVLGPLVVPLAVERVRREEDVNSKAVARDHAGAFDMLVALDGSEESRQAMAAALGLFGGVANSVTLATVLDFDAHGTPSGTEAREDAERLLESDGSSLEHDDLQTVILYGRPDQALAKYAADNGVELIVVGSRGRGATEAVFGSVTSRLASGSTVPIFVGGKLVPGPMSELGPD